MRKSMKRVQGVSLAVLAAAVLAACGGGGGDAGTDTAAASGNPGGTTAGSTGGAATNANAGSGTATGTGTATGATAGGTTSTLAGTLSGTVAFGAPLANAQLRVLDATGQQRSATADANGAYSLGVAGLTAPLLLTATGASGDAVHTYRTLVTSVPNGGAVVNVTPLTDAIVALASSDGSNPAEFADAAKLRALDTARHQQATAAVKAAVQTVASTLGDASFDPVSTAFVANRASAGDKILDAVKVGLSESGVTLRSALVTLGANDASAGATTVTLKDPAVTPAALPAPALTENLVMFDGFVNQLNACLALAPAARVSVDAVGEPSAFLGACAQIPGLSANYKRNGLNLLQYWGRQLHDVMPAGARAGVPEVLGLVKNAAGEDLAIVRLPFSSPLGGGSTIENARKTSAGWAIEGNQRNYDAGVSVRLVRSTDASSYGLVPTQGPDAGKNVGRFNTYSTRLHFNFNQAGPNGKDVYAVRITGPGLPAAGVVLARSSSCGTGDYLAFYSNNGSLPAMPALGATPPMPTAATSNGYTLRVAPRGTAYTGSDFFNEFRGRNADGTASTSSGNNIAPVAVDLGQVPVLSRYVFEVFKAGSAVAADSFAVRTVARPVAPEFADKLAWAEFKADSLAYANPADAAKAAALDAATLGWSVPAGGAPVSSAYLYGQGFDTGTPPVLRRMNMGANVAAFGDTSITLSAAVETNGNGNKCGYAKLPAFNASTGLRELGTRQTTAGNLVMQQLVYHAGRAAQ
jgi:hypothetical protein